MQKKLADYFRSLVEQREDLLAEYYEPAALLCSEEVGHITGMLLSLNIVDCNICMKEDNLDCQQGVIDFSLYLRNKREEVTAHAQDEDAPMPTSMSSSSTSAQLHVDEEQMNQMLNQKSYVEEINRQLT